MEEPAPERVVLKLKAPVNNWEDSDSGVSDMESGEGDSSDIEDEGHTSDEAVESSSVKLKIRLHDPVESATTADSQPKPRKQRMTREEEQEKLRKQQKARAESHEASVRTYKALSNMLDPAATTKTWKQYVHKCTSTFLQGQLEVVDGQTVDKQWFTSLGFRSPVICDSSQLGVEVVDNFGVDVLAASLGLAFEVSPVDTARDTVHMGWTFKQWLDYWRKGSRARQTVLSLTFDLIGTSLREIVTGPSFLPEVDWSSTIWCSSLQIPTPTPTLLRLPEHSLLFPQQGQSAVMRAGGAFTDFSTAPSGAAQWLSVQSGELILLLVPPIPHHLANYDVWCKMPDKSSVRFTSMISSPATAVHTHTLKAGMTILIPAGWIVATHNAADTIFLQGCFLHSYDIEASLKAAESEVRTSAPQAKRFPFFRRLCWMAGAHFCQLLRNLQQHMHANLSDEQKTLSTVDGPQLTNWELTGLTSLVTSLSSWLAQEQESSEDNKETTVFRQEGHDEIFHPRLSVVPISNGAELIAELTSRVHAQILANSLTTATVENYEALEQQNRAQEEMIRFIAQAAKYQECEYKIEIRAPSTVSSYQSDGLAPALPRTDPALERSKRRTRKRTVTSYYDPDMYDLDLSSSEDDNRQKRKKKKTKQEADTAAHGTTIADVNVGHSEVGRTSFKISFSKSALSAKPQTQTQTQPVSGAASSSSQSEATSKRTKRPKKQSRLPDPHELTRQKAKAASKAAKLNKPEKKGTVKSRLRAKLGRRW